MEVKKVGEVTVVTMEKRFDSAIAKENEAELFKLIESGAQKILCDFSHTEYISSAGLRVLLAVSKKLKILEGQIVLCALSSYVKEVFEIAGFIQIFEIYAAQEEALKSFVT